MRHRPKTGPERAWAHPCPDPTRRTRQRDRGRDAARCGCRRGLPRKATRVPGWRLVRCRRMTYARARSIGLSCRCLTGGISPLGTAVAGFISPLSSVFGKASFLFQGLAELGIVYRCGQRTNSPVNGHGILGRTPQAQDGFCGDGETQAPCRWDPNPSFFPIPGCETTGVPSWPLRSNGGSRSKLRMCSGCTGRSGRRF